MAYALLLLSTGSQLNGLYGPRIAIMLVLEGKYAQMISFLAPVCSSYSAVNVASSARSTSVRLGNKMISRPGRAACPPETPISFSFTFISLLKGGARKRKRKKEREREREKSKEGKIERERERTRDKRQRARVKLLACP